MRKIKMQELKKDIFDKYGNFSNMLSPEGVHLGNDLCAFYRDLNRMSSSSNIIGFSVTRIHKRELVITELEHHDYTGEALMPIDGDICIHVAPATAKGDLPLQSIEVFRVPKGTLVTLRPGTWHTGPFVVAGDIANVLNILPERCYTNDCTIMQIPEEEKVGVEGI